MKMTTIPTTSPIQEIIEWNKLIAEFHGWKHYPTPKQKGKGHWNFPEWGKASWNGDSFEYHKSWDWLMPAWIKFRKLDLKDERYSEWLCGLSWYLYSSDEPKRFFERLVYAIQWYNQQSKPTHP